MSVIVVIVILACVTALGLGYLASQLARQEAALWSIGERLKKADAFQRKLEGYLLRILPIGDDVRYLKGIEEVRQHAIQDAEAEQAIAEQAMTEHEKAAWDAVGLRVNAFRERLEEFEKGMGIPAAAATETPVAAHMEAPE